MVNVERLLKKTYKKEVKSYQQQFMLIHSLYSK